MPPRHARIAFSIGKACICRTSVRALHPPPWPCLKDYAMVPVPAALLWCLSPLRSLRSLLCACPRCGPCGPCYGACPRCGPSPLWSLRSLLWCLLWCLSPLRSRCVAMVPVPAAVPAVLAMVPVPAVVPSAVPSAPLRLCGSPVFQPSLPPGCRFLPAGIPPTHQVRDREPPAWSGTTLGRCWGDDYRICASASLIMRNLSRSQSLLYSRCRVVVSCPQAPAGGHSRRRPGGWRAKPAPARRCRRRCRGRARCGRMGDRG